MNIKKSIVLSDRLQAVANLVKSANCVADIGTDHGFVPIYLINSGACQHVIAMDINEGPLERARQHISEYGLDDCIETRLSNGMEKLLPGDADTIICAGMGGLLMKRILEDGSPRDKGVKQMILQPQSDLKSFREYLRNEHFSIEDEAEIFEDGKYYVAIRAVVSDDETCLAYEEAVKMLMSIEGAELSEEDATRICDRFGPCLLLKKDETLHAYLAHEKSVLEGILLKLSEAEHSERIHDIISKINDISIVVNS